LKERDAATTATETGGAGDANAERKSEYEEALRNERGKLYKEQEMSPRLREEQSASVARCGGIWQEIAQARERVTGEKEVQRRALSAQTETLAEQIAASVLGGRA
jgi:hypothetical protein